LPIFTKLPLKKLENLVKLDARKRDSPTFENLLF